MGGGGARWQWPGQWMMPITSPYIFITSTKIKQPSHTNDLSYRTSTKFFNFKLGAFQSKNTWVMIVLVETVHMQRYQASKNQFSASIYLKTILTYSDAKLR